MQSVIAMGAPFGLVSVEAASVSEVGRPPFATPCAPGPRALAGAPTHKTALRGRLPRAGLSVGWGHLRGRCLAVPSVFPLN